MLLWILKLTAFLLIGYVGVMAMRRTTAAMRHTLALGVIAGSLLIPMSMLVPAPAVRLNTSIVMDTLMSRAIAGGQGVRLSWATALEVIWAMGVLLVLTRLCIGYWRMARIRRTAAWLEQEILSGDVTVPVASGLLRASVLVPRDFAAWPEQRREAAIRHERTHIERRDLWANLIGNVACAIYWFHPLIWILNSRMRAEQEHACDEAVIASGFDRADYADALLAVARGSGPALIAGCCMKSRAELKDRIAGILRSGVTTTPMFHRLCVGVGVGIFVLAALAPVGAQTVYQVGGDVSAPRVIEHVDPEYTEEAKESKISGTAILSCVIRPDGMAHDCTVVRSLDPGLDRNAAEAIEKWHFAPGTLNGDAVSVSATIEVNFRLM
jgi:TonB family protein